MTAMMNTYGNRSTTLVRGEGAYLWDREGRRYLDALSGIAVCGLGHCHPVVTAAIQDQAKTLLHCSNLFQIEPQMQLGEQLVAISGLDRAFFSNSGAEANEAAIKIARKWANERGIEAPEIITAIGSFHGRTMATLSATGNDKVKNGFSPLVSGFRHVPFNDVDAIAAAGGKSTVAVMIEPVQGEGGIRVPDGDYLEKVRALCDERGWLLILDEIQSGNGRTGRYFGFQHSAILPDILTTAKGLGNGMPIGACLARGAAAEVLQPGNHGTTFGGNPLATRAALAVVSEINTPEFLKRVEQLGQHMLSRLSTELCDYDVVKEIRGKGLMLGVELNHPCGHLVEMAREEQGIVLNVTAGSVIRLLPPFILDDAQANLIVDGVVALVRHEADAHKGAA